jgi:riboflavin kinase / FMN adenylyltransferase
MQIVHHASELHRPERRACLAIGVFDGVHLGHQEVLHQTLRHAAEESSLAVAVTFDRHPSTIVAPTRVPPLIYPLSKRLRVIETLGLQAVLVIRFDAEFSRQSGESFIENLAADFGALGSICVGEDFSFGHQRSGNLSLLQTLGARLNFTAFGLPPVLLEGTPVSSTRIRDLIRHGDLQAARAMLGREYCLAGQVLRGNRLGTRMGFPTANLDVRGLILPPNGVYAVRVGVAGTGHQAVMNIGCRPTLGDQAPEIHAEVHLLDFKGDLYDQELEITFRSRLRDEQKFADLDALQTQIRADVVLARSRLETT